MSQLMFTWTPPMRGIWLMRGLSTILAIPRNPKSDTLALIPEHIKRVQSRNKALLLTFNLKDNFQITCKHQIDIENNLFPTCVRVVYLNDKNQGSYVIVSTSCHTLMPVILGGTCPRNTLSLSNLKGESLNPLRALSTAGSTVVNKRSLTYLKNHQYINGLITINNYCTRWRRATAASWCCSPILPAPCQGRIPRTADHHSSSYNEYKYRK